MWYDGDVAHSANAYAKKAWDKLQIVAIVLLKMSQSDASYGVTLSCQHDMLYAEEIHTD